LSSDVVIPQAVIWIMNGACNLRCIHCYASRFIEVEELRLEEKLRKYGVYLFISVDGSRKEVHERIRGSRNLG
jgi:MoaA/NifB/PqqE/SkfB family radical SAM enzyme